MDPNRAFKRRHHVLNDNQFPVYCRDCGWTGTVLIKQWEALGPDSTLLCGKCRATDTILVDIDIHLARLE